MITKPHLWQHDREKIWEALLTAISSGSSLPAALAQLPEPRPSLFWAKSCVRVDPELMARYRTAMEERADTLADQICAVADETPPPGLTAPEITAWVARQRLRVDAMKWTASKLRPRVWGDHLALNVAVEQRISITAALEAAQRRLTTLSDEPVLELEESAHMDNG